MYNRVVASHLHSGKSLDVPERSWSPNILQRCVPHPPILHVMRPTSHPGLTLWTELELGPALRIRNKSKGCFKTWYLVQWELASPSLNQEWWEERELQAPRCPNLSTPLIEAKLLLLAYFCFGMYLYFYKIGNVQYWVYDFSYLDAQIDNYVIMKLVKILFKNKEQEN